MYYFTRVTKDDSDLITSYKDEAQAKKFAKQESTSKQKKIWSGEMYFDLDSGDFGAAASGVGMVSYIKTGKSVAQSGRYAVYSKLDGKPNDLGVRFTAYGEANKFMKAIAPGYDELWVLELEKVGKGDPISADEEDEGIYEVTDEAPF